MFFMSRPTGKECMPMSSGNLSAKTMGTNPFLGRPGHDGPEIYDANQNVSQAKETDNTVFSAWNH